MIIDYLFSYVEGVLKSNIKNLQCAIVETIGYIVNPICSTIVKDQNQVNYLEILLIEH